MAGGLGTTIKFQEEPTATSTSFFPILTIHSSLNSNGNSQCNGYYACRNGICDAYMASLSYHELGHCLGLGIDHAINRGDWRHYGSHYQYPGQTCAQLEAGWWGLRGSIPAAQNLRDYGPFDYLSAMMPRVALVPLARWDGSPMMPVGETCTQGPTSLPTASCAGAFCQPSCSMCEQAQPSGFPSLGDASAAVELYRNQSDPGWRKFLRTVAEPTGTPGTEQPYDYRLATTPTSVTIPTNATPAVAFEAPSGRPSNLHHRQRRERLTRSSAPLRAAPGLAGATQQPWRDRRSDPAVVFVGGRGRYDLVVRRSNDIHIRTFQGGSSGPWQSLDHPANTPPSTPAITSSGPNRLDVFVRDNNNNLYWKKCTAACNGATGTWSGWTQVPGTETFRGKPAAVSSTTGVVYVFVQNLSGQVRTINKSASEVWSSWSTVSASALPGGAPKWDSNCAACSSPAADMRGILLDVYVRGIDDKIWVASTAIGLPFTSFFPIGGVSTSSPASVSMASSTLSSAIAITMREEVTRTSSAVTFANGVWLKEYDRSRTWPAQVALGRNATGRLDAIYTGINDVAYSKWQSPVPASDTWTGNLMNQIKDRAKLVTIGVNSDARLTAIYTGADDDLLRYATQTTAGGGYNQGAVLVNATSSPTIDMAVAPNQNGLLHMVYIGNDLVLHQTTQTSSGGAWDGEHLLDQPLSAGKRVVMPPTPNSNGVLEAVFIGSNDVLHSATQNGQNSQTWTISVLVTPTTTAKRVTVGRNSTTGGLHVAYIGLDDVLYQTFQSTPGGTWSAPQLLGQSSSKAKELTMAQDDDGHLEVLLIDMNNVIQRARQNTQGGAVWTLGVIESTNRGARLAAAKGESKQIEVVYVGTDDTTLYRMRQNGINSLTWTSAVGF